MQPVLHQHKEVGIPTWLRSEYRGVADRDIENLTSTEPFSPQRSRRSVDSKSNPSGKNKTPSSPRGSNKGSPQCDSRKGSPRQSMRSIGGGGGASMGLNWHAVYEKHGRMTIGKPR